MLAETIKTIAVASEETQRKRSRIMVLRQSFLQNVKVMARTENGEETK